VDPGPVCGRLRAVATRLPAPTPGAEPLDPTTDAARVFSLSLMVSGLRCLLTYIVLPWVLPLVGLARGVGPVVSVTVGVVAIAFNVLSIRRFARSNHPWRRPLMALNSAVIIGLLFLIVNDVAELVS
jgi:hypothetical protein